MNVSCDVTIPHCYDSIYILDAIYLIHSLASYARQITDNPLKMRFIKHTHGN